MKIYTRRGDSGSTSLYNGERVSKDDARIEVNGEIDELNARLGLVRSLMQKGSGTEREIEAVQFCLMRIMTAIATPGTKQVEGLDEAVKKMETAIDQLLQDEKFNFVLPGSSTLEACLHMARTQTRTIERLLWTLNRESEVPSEVMRYMNRLSDYLYALALKKQK